MGQQNHEFAKKLLATFKVEAEEHLRTMSRRLLELEKAPGPAQQMEILETVFREAHSLKGAARAVNLTDVEALCRSLENVFSALKRRVLSCTPALFDLLHTTLDGLRDLFPSTREEKGVTKKVPVAELVQAIERHLAPREGRGRAAEGKEIEREPAPVSRAAAAQLDPAVRSREGEKVELPDTVRVSTTKLNSLMLQAEELLSVRLALAERAEELRKLAAELEAWEKQRAKIQPDVRALDRAREEKAGASETALAGTVKKKVLEYVEWNDGLVKLLGARISAVKGQVERDHRTLSGMTDGLLGDIKESLMLPFSVLLEPFPRLVRDLSRDRQKEVDFIVQGAEVEADRRVLEEMKDPLIHLIRNCVDHGIESPGERQRKEKPSRGRIVFSISQKEGDKFEIEVSDDGAGIDVAKVRVSAAKLGILPLAEARRLDDAAACSLIFQSGVSTSPIITDISGRGLGLAIVDEKVRGLGGTISLEMHPGLGTTFRIHLPVTLATFRGVLVRAGGHLFVLPTAHVERAARLDKKEVKTVENRETVQLDGEPVSLVRLENALGLSRGNLTAGSLDAAYVVVVESARKRIAFLVDEILQEQEVLVKTLGPQLGRVRGIAGAAVLGTGQVVPVLSAADLVKGAAKVSPARFAAEAAEEPPQVRRSILVAEDSITARTLLKNILESAGYHVRTAVDGADAFTALRMEEFDVVVSDVDMPRMNGFELTSRIRSDKRMSELPVVLVTALESREDREHGIDVGADAYIVKSSFDQSNLLEVIRRLL